MILQHEMRTKFQSFQVFQLACNVSALLGFHGDMTVLAPHLLMSFFNKAKNVSVYIFCINAFIQDMLVGFVICFLLRLVFFPEVFEGFSKVSGDYTSDHLFYVRHQSFCKVVFGLEVRDGHSDTSGCSLALSNVVICF